MDPKNHLLWLVLLMFLSSACQYADQAQTRSETPNIVLFFIDDMGYADIGPYGASAYKTPNLDQLASEGVRFTDFYVSQPVCSASRASLLTGSYANRIGIHGALGPGNTHGIHSDEITIAEMVRSKGYATAIFGKWHLGHHEQFLPINHGFDEFYGIPYSNDMWPFHPENPKAWGDLPTLEGFETVGLNTDQSRFTTDFTARAIQFIETESAAKRPFFVYVAHPMPHVPLFVSDEGAGRSGAGLFGDVISEIDWSVGQVLQSLEDQGVSDNTIVIFTSDNGPWLSYGNHAGSAGFLREGKGTAFDGGVRVPFIAKWPGVWPEGSTVTTPAMTIDLLPTLAEILGAQLPSHPIDGQSISGLLEGTRSEPVQEAYYFYYNTNELHAMRSGKWKLQFPHSYRTMEGREPGKDGIPGKYDYGATIGLELFDMEADPGETTNVAAQHPEVVEHLVALADSKRLELGDKLTGVEGKDNREPGRIPDSSEKPQETKWPLIKTFWTISLISYTAWRAFIPNECLAASDFLKTVACLG